MFTHRPAESRGGNATAEGVFDINDDKKA